MIWAGLSMMKLRRHKLCMMASIPVMPAACVWIVLIAVDWKKDPVILLPVLCLLIWIPLGIWSRMTLRKPGMRSAFRLNEEQVRPEESLADLDRR